MNYLQNQDVWICNEARTIEPSDAPQHDTACNWQQT